MIFGFVSLLIYERQKQFILANIMFILSCNFITFLVFGVGGLQVLLIHLDTVVGILAITMLHVEKRQQMELKFLWFLVATLQFTLAGMAYIILMLPING